MMYTVKQWKIWEKESKLRIIKKEKDFIKYASRPKYINYDICGKRLIAIHEKKEQLTLNKPIYVGCTVLELTKLEMYKFHYDFMKKEFNYLVLWFTDTDSLYYEFMLRFLWNNVST